MNNAILVGRLGQDPKIAYESQVSETNKLLLSLYFISKKAHFSFLQTTFTIENIQIYT